MNKSGTICLFNSNTSWGGGEKWILETAISLSDKKYDIIVCANKGSKLHQNLKKSGSKLMHVSIYNLSFIDPFKLYYLYRVFKKHKVDTVILGLSQDLKAAGLAARLAGVRNIIYRRGLANPLNNSLLYQLYFKKIVSRVIANSEEVKRSLLVKNGSLINKSDISVIFNGILLPTENVTDFKADMNGSPVVIGNVGRLIEVKGHKYLIEMAALLKKGNINFVVKIVGIGKMRLYLENYAKKLDVESSVIFVDFLHETSNFYKEIDIFVFPSASEGSSNAILEAMAHAKPVVAFDISSMPEMVDDGKTGCLVPFRDVQSLSDKVTFLSTNASLRKRMGENARQKITEKFDFNKNLQLLENLL